MLRKLFKYDFKYIAKYTIPAMIAALCAALAATGILRIMMSYDFDKYGTIGNIAEITGGILLFFCVLFIILFNLIVTVIILKRYYDNCFTDEGYLTFTLPTDSNTILVSKVLAGVLWSMITGIIMIGCLAILVLFGTSQSGVINHEITEFLSSGLKLMSENPQNWLVAMEILVMTIVSVFFSITVFYLAITIGSIIAKKHKILASIGIYYGINIILSILMEIFMTIFAVSTYSPIDYEYSVSISVYGTIHLTIGIFTLIFAGLAVGAYLITRHLLSKKLNLS